MNRRSFLKSAAAVASLGSSSLAAPRRFLGITVLPEYIQTEGIDGLLKNLIERAGATAVATSPYLMIETDSTKGSREPPADAGAGAVRLLDRPLFGKRDLFVTTTPAYEANAAVYKNLRYQPAPASDLTKKQGHLVADFLKEAKAAGLKTYLQVQAAIPPGYRVQFGGPQDEDLPRMPDGSVPKGRVDKNGSLASPHILDYEQALFTDLLDQYPEIDGLRPDWPEYPPYSLDSWFVDFSPPAEAAASRMGLNFKEMREEAAALYKDFHGGLTNDKLAGMTALPELKVYEFKARLVEEFITAIRDTLTKVAGREKELVPNAFPLPWSRISGLDYARVAPHVQGISSKLYSMHWSMMLRFYGEQIMKANAGLDSAEVAKALQRWFQVADGDGLPAVEAYHYPEPDEPHHYGPAAMAQKIQQAQKQAAECPVYALAHGYGPQEDYERRMRIAWTSSRGQMWVNRYGYLTDEKLSALKRISA
jgi:hypothetical protein